MGGWVGGILWRGGWRMGLLDKGEGGGLGGGIEGLGRVRS